MQSVILFVTIKMKRKNNNKKKIVVDLYACGLKIFNEQHGLSIKKYI